MKTKNHIIFIISAISIVLGSCVSKTSETTEKPVARVFEKKLFPSDLKNIVPMGISKSDSLELIKKHIEKWIQEELVLRYAEENLTTEQLTIDKEVNEYRKNLIIYNYQTELIRQKLDTSVSSEEIEEYYGSHLSSFILKDDIVDVYYIKLNKTTSGVEKVRKWYTSSNPKDIENLRSFCIQFADNYFIEDNTWLLFDDILKEVPIENYNTELFFKNNSNIELADSSYYYFLRIKSYKIKNSPSPLSFEIENIKNNIINKRKLKLVDNMKKQVYINAQDAKNFEIYK